MKRFVSILIVLAFVMSAQAVPAKQASKVATKSARIEAFQQHVPAAMLKHLEQQKAGERTVRPVVKKAHKAVADEPITIVGNNLEEDEFWGYPFIYGGNDEYTVEVDFWGTTTFGTYKQGDEDIEILIYDNSAGDDDEGIWLDFTEAVYKMTEKGLYFYAIGTGDDGNLYEIILTRYAPEQPKDTLREEFKITKSEGDAYSEAGIYYAYAEGEKYVCEFAIDNMVVKAGKYEGNDLLKDFTAVYAINGKDTTHVGNYFTAHLDVTIIPGSYIFKLGYFAMDSNYYELTVPVKAYEAETPDVEYDFGDSKVYKTYYAETQDFYLYVEDENYVMSLDILGKKLASSFTAENKDFDTYYTTINQIVGNDTTELDYRNVTVTITEGTTAYTIVAAFYLKGDNKWHKYTAKYVKPTPTKTETYNLPDAQFQDYRQWYKDFMVVAAPADSSVVFVFDIYSMLLPGTFTEFDLGGEYSVVHTGGHGYAIEQANLISKVTTDMTLMTLEGEVLANSVLYKLTITCPLVEAGIGKVESGELKVESTTKIFRNGQILIVKDGELYNLLGTKVE